MPLYKVALLSFVALITMVNPLAVVPSFVALTDGARGKTRAASRSWRASRASSCSPSFFLAGNYVFNFFGITVPAFQIMGGSSS